ncbi:glycosyltransferase family 4 protein [Actinokineospora sp.]|uniref:glycosyltransferase family 4 protein n=1 Tax=Actinokineospora sp. TaxID=1872133 RepID=UPI004037AE58
MRDGVRALAGVRVALVNWRDPGHPLAGGAEEYAWRVAEAISAAGGRVVYLTARAPGQTRSDRSGGITTVRRGGQWTVYLWTMWWLLRHRRSIDVVVDCQNGIPFFSPLVTARRTGVVLVVHHVHDSQFGVHFPAWLAAVGRWLEGPASKVVYRRAVTVAVSPSTVDAMRERLTWRGKVFVVPNGLTRRAVTRSARSDTPALVCLGRLVTHKRVDDLVQVTLRLRERWPDLRLHVIGRGPREQAVRELAERSDGAVVVHGYVDDATKSALLTSSWLHVTLSDGEGWGLAVLEAAEHGLPTVCLTVDGLRDSVRHGETGWLVPPGGDVADTIDAALRHLADPDAAAEVTDSCVRWAGRFDWADTGRRFVRVVAGGHRGGHAGTWRPEAMVAEFSGPPGLDGILSTVDMGAAGCGDGGRGWLLAEQCRPGDLLDALTAAGLHQITIRPAKDIERLLGAPLPTLDRVT